MSNKQRDEAKERMRAQTLASSQQTSSSLEERLARIQNAALPDGSVLAIPTKRIDVDSIGRRSSDLRPLNQEHVLRLAKSFAFVGMIQFPVVDLNDVLVAGEHRREAVALLKEVRNASLDQVRLNFTFEGQDEPSDEDLLLIQGAYDKHFADGVIVHVMDTTDIKDEDVRSRIEFIENDHRRDFTPDEIRGYIEKLKEAGYRSTSGRPQAGEKVLSKELGIVLHKSRATVFRMLKELDNPSEKHLASPRSIELGRKATEQLGTKVKVKEKDKESGSIVVEYTSLRHRSELMRTLGLLE